MVLFLQGHVPPQTPKRRLLRHAVPEGLRGARLQQGRPVRRRPADRLLKWILGLFAAALTLGVPQKAAASSLLQDTRPRAETQHPSPRGDWYGLPMLVIDGLAWGTVGLASRNSGEPVYTPIVAAEYFL